MLYILIVVNKNSFPLVLSSKCYMYLTFILKVKDTCQCLLLYHQPVSVLGVEHLDICYLVKL